MSKRRHPTKPFQALPLIASLAVALSLFLAHNSSPLQDLPAPKVPEQDGEKPADDPRGKNPQTPPTKPDDKQPPNRPPDPQGDQPVPQPGVPSVPESVPQNQ